MYRKELSEILRSHQLRRTNCRIDVLRLFQSSKAALTLSDLEKNVQGHDRATLYRTLTSFIASGLLHKIPNETGMATYGLCPSSCGPDAHQHNHIHFQCNACRRMECIDQQIVQQVQLPQGYESQQAHLIIDGLCPNCSTH